MMGGMRSFVKSPWAVGLLVVLAASFGIFGFKDPFNGVVGGGFMSAGDRSIHPNEVNRMIDQAIDRVRKEQGKSLSRREAGQQGIPQQVLSDLTQQTVILAYADKVGIKASPSAVADIIGNAPIFRDGLGNIDQKAIERYANDQRMSVAQFQSDIQDGLTFDYLQQAILGGLEPPKIISGPIISYLGEKRTVVVARATRETAPDIKPPTDAELKTYYESKKAMFAQPERRRFTALNYSANDFLDKVKIDDKALKEQYDRRIKEFSTPETRDIAQFSSTDEKAIQDVVDLVKQGKKLEDVVSQAKGVTLTTLTVKPGDLKDKTYNDDVFALPSGETFGPIKVGDTFFGVKVNSVTPGVPTPLADVADQIRVDMSKRDAQRLYDASNDQFLDYVSGGKPLDEIASEIGAPLFVLPAVDARGNDQNGAPVSLLAKNPKDLQNAFKLNVGENSAVMEGDGERTVLRLDEIIPAHTPKLDEVRSDVVELYMRDKEIEAVQKAADKMVAAVKSGKSFDDAAKMDRMGVIRPPQPISRATAGQLDPKILGAMFSLPEGGVMVAQTSQGEPWVVMVNKIDEVAPEQADAKLVSTVDNNVRQSVTQDVFQSFLRGVQKEVKVRTNNKAIQDFIADFTKDNAG